MAKSSSVTKAYDLARERYAALGVDTEGALKAVRTLSVSLHCWQGDDVGGFENAGGPLGGGLAVTGNYPGKARTPDELRADLDKALGSPTVTNVWVPDGYKDTPADRLAPRERLTESLDAIFKKPLKHNYDAVEPKLFGIGSESYVVGSHEFYLGYAISRQKVFCLDAGHFHPTEGIADKISSVFQYVPRVLLHVSRGVRWDSDHVVTLTDDLQAIAQELVRGKYLPRTHLGLDYFDASINRIAAWVIGTRNFLKALLIAMLEPIDKLRAAEHSGDLTPRLALQEEAKSMPFGAVWDAYCEQQNVPVGEKWLAEVKSYETKVLTGR